VQLPFCRVRANRTLWAMLVPDLHFASQCRLMLSLK